MEQNPSAYGQDGYNPTAVIVGQPVPQNEAKMQELPRGQVPIDDKQTDYMLYGITAAVLLVGILLAFKPTHVLPRTSTTFSMQRVDDLTKFIENYDAEDLDTHANYVMSNFNKINHLHPVGGHKYSVECYGPKLPVLDPTKLWFQTQSDLTMLQTTQDTLLSISVCTCITHTSTLLLEPLNFSLGTRRGLFLPNSPSSWTITRIDRFRSPRNE